MSRYDNARQNDVGGSREAQALSLRDALRLSLAKHRLQGGLRKVRAAVLWPEIAGPELARITRARQQRGGTLFVEVRDSAAAHVLTMQRATLLRRLQAELGDQSVTELRFSVGHIQPPVTAPPETLPAPDKARAQAMADALPHTAAPELRDAVLRAAQATTRARRWREQRGYPPCPVCGEPSRQQPCQNCELNLQDPLVRRAAGQLVRQPAQLERLPQTLGHAGSEAARYLALQGLTEQLEALRHCAEDPTYRDFLRQQAEHYLRLLLRRAPQSPDWQALPPAVYAALFSQKERP